jgi:hypothetical protein
MVYFQKERTTVFTMIIAIATNMNVTESTTLRRDVTSTYLSME